MRALQITGLPLAQQTRTLQTGAMQSSMVPAQTNGGFDINTIMNLMIMMMVVVMMMKMMTKATEAV